MGYYIARTSLPPMRTPSSSSARSTHTSSPRIDFTPPFSPPRPNSITPLGAKCYKFLRSANWRNLSVVPRNNPGKNASPLKNYASNRITWRMKYPSPPPPHPPNMRLADRFEVKHKRRWKIRFRIRLQPWHRFWSPGGGSQEEGVIKFGRLAHT